MPRWTFIGKSRDSILPRSAVHQAIEDERNHFSARVCQNRTGFGVPQRPSRCRGVLDRPARPDTASRIILVADGLVNEVSRLSLHPLTDIGMSPTVYEMSDAKVIRSHRLEN